MLTTIKLAIKDHVGNFERIIENFLKTILT
jgi:hypothetical protein